MKHTARIEKSTMWEILSLGTFCPLGRFILGTFCPLGRFVSWDVLSLWMFCPYDLMSEDVLSWDVWPLGRFVLGRFVCAPSKICQK